MEDPERDIEQVIMLLTTAVNPEIQKATILKYFMFTRRKNQIDELCIDFTSRMPLFATRCALYPRRSPRLRVMPFSQYFSGTVLCHPVSRCL